MIGWKLVDEDKDPVALSSDMRASGWENVLFLVRDDDREFVGDGVEGNASISHRWHPVRVSSPDEGT